MEHVEHIKKYVKMILSYNDPKYQNKTFYGLIQYNFKVYMSPYGKAGQIIYFTEKQQDIIKKINKIYNGKKRYSGTIILYRIKNIEPELINLKIINYMPKELCEYITIIKNGNKNYYLSKLTIDNVFDDFIDILKEYKNIFTNFEQITDIDNTSLLYLIYDNFEYIKHANILCNMAKILKSKNKKEIKDLCISGKYKCKWYHTKSNMINNLLKYVKIIE